jgi:hypothetical protein
MTQARIALRYALPNALVVAMIVAITLGTTWIWAIFIVALVVGGLSEESLGDDATHVGNRWRKFYDFNLYLTLPLLIVLALAMFFRARPFTLLDPAHLSLSGFVNNFTEMLLANYAGYPAAVGVMGYFFAVAGSTAAHELGHRVHSRSAVLCARALDAFTCNWSFEVYHGRFHHRNVGYFHDPSTARRLESLFAFMRRSVVDQMALAWTHERTRLQRRGVSAFSWQSRVMACAYMSLAIAVTATLIGGLVGLGGFVIAAAIARVLHETTNYTQHYGLTRVEGTPIAARHSWDSHRMVSSALLYNLPRHAEHHRAGAKPFWELDTSNEAPRLPFGYQTATLVAFIPPLWRRAMAPLLADWDARLASDGERALVRDAEANRTGPVEDSLVAAATTGLLGQQRPR